MEQNNWKTFFQRYWVILLLTIVWLGCLVIELAFPGAKAFKNILSPIRVLSAMGWLYLMFIYMYVSIKKHRRVNRELKESNQNFSFRVKANMLGEMIERVREFKRLLHDVSNMDIDKRDDNLLNKLHIWHKMNALFFNAEMVLLQNVMDKLERLPGLGFDEKNDLHAEIMADMIDMHAKLWDIIMVYTDRPKELLGAHVI